MNINEKLIQEYSEAYCSFLEATYEKSMMSEGGSKAIDRLFEGIDIDSKNLLDIGFGLGGVCFYVAEKYHACVTGIELNPWLVEEAKRRTPEHLQAQLNFVAYKSAPLLPFDDEVFDVVFSKGVLTHVRDKQPLFDEIYRVLKPGGIFVVDDWLSPTQDVWCDLIRKMCEMEDLTLFAETPERYRGLLENSQFQQIQMRDENLNYAQYNTDIVSRLERPDEAKRFISAYGEKAWAKAIEAYGLIATAIRHDELLIRRFKAVKTVD